MKKNYFIRCMFCNIVQHFCWLLKNIKKRRSSRLS